MYAGKQWNGPLPDRMFHGTSHDIPIGGAVLPGKQAGVEGHWTGMPNHDGTYSEDHAFATTSEDTAWSFAGSSASHFRLTGQGRKRERVYRVAPHPDSVPGRYGDLHEWIGPAHKVVDQLDIQPGRQGTFPEINWHQFGGAQGYSDFNDHNHPSSFDVAYGHEGSTLRNVTTAATNAHGVVENLGSPMAPRVHPHQMDLFSGETASMHSLGIDGDRDMAKYHRTAISGNTAHQAMPEVAGRQWSAPRAGWRA